MEKHKEIPKSNFNIQEAISFVNSEKYLEEERDLSKEVINKINFDNIDNIKDFLNEFIGVFKEEKNPTHTTLSLSKEIIYEFLKQRSANEILENTEIRELFSEALQINNGLQNQ